MKGHPDTESDAKKRKNFVKSRNITKNARRLFTSIKARSSASPKSSFNSSSLQVHPVAIQQNTTAIPKAAQQNLTTPDRDHKVYYTKSPGALMRPISTISTPVPSPLHIISSSDNWFPSTSASGLHMAIDDNEVLINDSIGADERQNNVIDYVINADQFPEQFADRFQQIEVEQREIRKELKQMAERQSKFEVAMIGYMEELTKCIPQLMAKVEALGSGNSSSLFTKSVRVIPTFHPINSEAELVELNEKAKNYEFIDQTIECLGQICGKDTMKDGRDAGYAVVDNFATRQFWTTCTWTGTCGSDNPKFCLSKYLAFINLIEEAIRFSTPSWTKLQNQQFIIKSILGNSSSRHKRDKQLKCSRSRASGAKGIHDGETPEKESGADN